MSKYYTMGPFNIEEYHAIVLGLNTVADHTTGVGSKSERQAARRALKNLDPRILVQEVEQGEEVIENGDPASEGYRPRVVRHHRGGGD